jgi:hypothetical protein|nr:MAG: hypothetical protein [Lake Baikal virophage 3]
MSKLFDYPITELKNVAKQYNLAYYIDNIERLSKSQLIDSILDHMKWKKAQNELENTVDVTLSLEPITTNYEKERDKTNPRIRKNYAELREETAHARTKPAHQPIPNYKGRKDGSKIQVEALEPQVYEVVMDGKIPSVFEFVNTFHNLDPADQTKIVNTLGMTEAQALPEGIVAFGDLTEEEEKEVATNVIEAVKVARKEIIENVKEVKSVLEEYKSKLRPREDKAYYPDMEKWRLVRIAELLIEKPSLYQSQIGKLLEKDGFKVGTAQSSVSKQLLEVAKLNLIPKNAPKPPVVPVKEEPKVKQKEELKQEIQKPITKEEKEIAFLENLKKEGYKYEPPKGKTRKDVKDELEDLWEKASSYVEASEEKGDKPTSQKEKEENYVRRKAEELNYTPDRRFAFFSLGGRGSSLKQTFEEEKKYETIKLKEHDFVNVLGKLLSFYDDPNKKILYDSDLINDEIKAKKGRKSDTLHGFQPVLDRSMLMGSGTHRENIQKKYALEDKGYSLQVLAKITGVSKKTLQEVYNRGIGAYKTNPTSVRMKGSFEKGVNAPMSMKLSKEQWAMSRVYSFLDGNPKHDEDLRG